MFAHVVAVLWLAVGATVVSAGTALIAKGRAYLVAQEARVKNADLRQALQFATGEACSAAQTVVTSLNATAVNALKASGKWDAATASAVKAQAVSLLHGVISQDAQAVLQKAMADVPGFLSALVEEAVALAPNKTQAPKPEAAATGA